MLRIAGFLQRKYRKLRHSYHNTRLTLSGRRFDDLEDRIDRLDRRMADRSHHGDAFVIQDSCFRLGASPCQPDALAVISCMPPAHTGIATCTLHTFAGTEYPVDIFSSYDSAHAYLLGLSDERLRNRRIRIFDASALPLARAHGAYRGQLFVLGNSDHNVPIALQLRQSRHFPCDTPLHLYIHDPCLLNLCLKVSEAEGATFRRTLCSAYGLSVDRKLNFDDLIADNIYGVRALFKDLPVASVIVNSNAAAAMIETELPRVPIHVMFHPTLPVRVKSPIKASGFRIGSFGVPNGSKQTDLVTAAFQILRRTIPDATLVLAGFDAGPYADHHRLRPADGYEIHDAPDDDTFDALLASVDVAVQLRKHNLGESSGPVARLLELGKPVVVSNVGSFADYREVARMIDSSACNPEELADIIVQERSPDMKRRLAIEAFRKSHSPQAFRHRLAEIIPARAKLGIAKG